MKLYEKALEIIRKDATEKVKKNQLLKIVIKTEDQKFRVYLEHVISAYECYVKPGWTRHLSDKAKEQGKPSNNRESIIYINKRVKLLRTYLEERLAEKKPEWQVIAEKNGWAPIKETSN